VTISRAFKWLEDRGLGEHLSGIYTRWPGFRLSDQCIKVARKAELRDALET
jgi:hypothetical protein